MRWLILALFIGKIIPWYLKRRCTALDNRIHALSEELDYAQSQQASYESLREIEYYLVDNQKLKAVFEKTQNRYLWVAIGLISVELFAVQLPHLL